MTVPRAQGGGAQIGPLHRHRHRQYVEGTGLGPFEGATIRVLLSGRVRLMTGAAPQGQGHRTIVQIAADHLGVPIQEMTW